MLSTLSFSMYINISTDKLRNCYKHYWQTLYTKDFPIQIFYLSLPHAGVETIADGGITFSMNLSHPCSIATWAGWGILRHSIASNKYNNQISLRITK